MNKFRKTNDPVCKLTCWTNSSICIGERGCAEYYKKYLRRPHKRRKVAKRASNKSHLKIVSPLLTEAQHYLKCSVCGHSEFEYKQQATP